MSKPVFTIGHTYSNTERKMLKLPVFLSVLQEYNITSVIDLRNIIKPIQGSYAPIELSKELEDNKIRYVSRVEEAYTFYQTVKTIMNRDEKLQFFRSHMYRPILNYIKVLNQIGSTTALLFNHWELHSKVRFSGGFKYQNNLKGSFSKYVKTQQVDIELIHISPVKVKGEFKAYDNSIVLGKGEGNLLDIEDYLNPEPEYVNYYDHQDDLQDLIDWEWKGMNEESGGAAHWNID